MEGVQLSAQFIHLITDIIHFCTKVLVNRKGDIKLFLVLSALFICCNFWIRAVVEEKNQQVTSYFAKQSVLRTVNKQKNRLSALFSWWKLTPPTHMCLIQWLNLHQWCSLSHKEHPQPRTFQVSLELSCSALQPPPQGWSSSTDSGIMVLGSNCSRSQNTFKTKCNENKTSVHLYLRTFSPGHGQKGGRTHTLLLYAASL